jgi:hypothetical protein
MSTVKIQVASVTGRMCSLRGMRIGSDSIALFFVPGAPEPLRQRTGLVRQRVRFRTSRFMLDRIGRPDGHAAHAPRVRHPGHAKHDRESAQG